MTLILSRTDVVELLSLPECIDAVERAFRLHAEGRTLGPGVLGVPAAGGGFHIKVAGLVGPSTRTRARPAPMRQRFVSRCRGVGSKAGEVGFQGMLDVSPRRERLRAQGVILPRHA